jgi:hypothetical protein
MTRTEVRTFLNTGVDSLAPSTEFGSGLITDFNSDRSNVYPSVWQNIKPVSPDLASNGAPLDTWDIELIIAQKDAMDSAPEQYESIIDASDLIAQKLIYLYRNVIDGYKLVSLTSINRTPFVKKYADCLSGVNLTFKIVVPDKTNVC